MKVYKTTGGIFADNDKNRLIVADTTEFYLKSEADLALKRKDAEIEKLEEIIVNHESGLLEKIKKDRDVFELKQKLSYYTNCISSDENGIPHGVNDAGVCTSCARPHFIKAIHLIKLVADLQNKLALSEAKVEKAVNCLDRMNKALDNNEKIENGGPSHWQISILLNELNSITLGSLEEGGK